MGNVFEIVRDLSTIAYSDALAKQVELHDQVVRGDIESAVLVLEHEPVLTLGRSADPAFIIQMASNVPVVRTDRGGEVTAHMPGQIVLYPIVPVQKWGISPKRYVCLLEQSVINLLKSLGVNAGRDDINPGIWVGLNKICAIGVRIKNRVTMHGAALNVSCDFSLFNQIVPCGIQGRGVARLIDILGDETPELEDLKKLWLTELNAIFASELQER